jgi:RimJ/RimL family protein N-acetyltransferase
MLVGDAAVGLDPTGSVAGLGYTLAPASQGRGFASEAAAALVDAVFARTPVHRMLVTLDPDNHASLRVVEPLGFRYEGLARQAERIRGEWVDDLRFALLRDEHAAWRSRPRTPPGLLELVPITTGNLDAVGDLTTFRFQQAFVSPMARSLAQALVPGEHHGRPITPWFRAIVADGEVAGFVMVAEPDAGSPDPYLWRLLIDRAHQRRGIGRRTVAALVRTFAATGRTAMLVSWREGPGGPENFYRGLGFVPTGEKDEDEIVARLTFGDVRT